MSVHLSVEEALSLARDTLIAAGFCLEDAEACADLLIETTLDGVMSHDLVAHLPLYAEYARAGVGNGPPPIIESRTGAIALIAGCGSSGPRAMRLAEQTCAQLARENGVGIVVARTIGYFGALRWTVLPLARQGLIGLVSCNAMASEPPAGGIEPLSGTNPLAIAFPAKPHPIVVDMRTNGIDPEGARGYGLALAIDLFTAGLAGTPIGREVQWETERSNLAAFVLAIDVSALGRAAFDASVERLVDQIIATRPTDKAKPVRPPGWRAADANWHGRADGIEIACSRWAELRSMLASQGIGLKHPADPVSCSE